MTPRLLCPGPLRTGQAVALDAEQSHYLARVLRLRAGDAVQLFDGQGARFAATVATADPRAAGVEVGEAEPACPESPLRVALAQCVSAADKMDWTIEKAVELGVAAIQPLVSRRAVVRLDAERARRRLEHWRRLVAAACMQCGRDRLPPIEAPRAIDDWLASRDPSRAGIVLAPGAGLRISRLPAPPGPVDLLVGPESGLDEAEVRAALAAGFAAVSLGPRVLRTETAGLAALAAMQARFGDA